MVAIIILNWNGDKDTVELLESLYNSNNSDYFVLLIDNGSNKESTIVLEKWAEGSALINRLHKIEYNNITIPTYISHKDLIFYKSSSNLGFSKANNLGLKILSNVNYNYALLLNNDTIVTDNFLDKLRTFLLNNRDYDILTPMILYHYKPDTIWNCGGSLKFGFRKYLFADKTIESIPKFEYKDISFVTGCALFIRKCIIEPSGIFTENFFHGEEDFEFSYRMKVCRKKMACIHNSIIFHKVGQSTVQMNNIGKAYVHYLNRYIDMRIHMPKLKFIIWKTMSNIYILYLLKRLGVENKSVYKFISKLNKEYIIYDGVTHEMFHSYLKFGID